MYVDVFTDHQLAACFHSMTWLEQVRPTLHAFARIPLSSLAIPFDSLVFIYDGKTQGRYRHREQSQSVCSASSINIQASGARQTLHRRAPPLPSIAGAGVDAHSCHLHLHSRSQSRPQDTGQRTASYTAGWTELGLIAGALPVALIASYNI